MANMMVSDGVHPMGTIRGFSNYGGNLPNSYTWEFWFRADDLTQEQIIGGIRGAGNQVQLGIKPNDWGSGAHFFVTLDGNQHVLKDVSLKTTGTWYHVALVHQGLGQGRGEFRLYLYGKLEYKLFETQNNHELPMDRPMDFGANVQEGFFSVTNQILSGAIDEVRIWKEARRQVDIEAAMGKQYTEAEATALANSLLAYIPFDGQTENYGYKDITGHSNEISWGDNGNGTLGASNNTLRGTDPDAVIGPNVIIGGPKTALHFPGTQDAMVSIPSSRTLNDFGDTVTIDCWIHPEANLAAGDYTIVHKEDAFWLGLRVVSSPYGGSSATLVYILNTFNRDDMAQTIFQGNQINLGQWSHVAVTGAELGGNVYHKGWVNGAGKNPDNLGAHGTALDPNAHDLTIGASENVVRGFKPFHGMITEVRLWKQDFQKPVPLPPATGGVPMIQHEDYRWSELPATTTSASPYDPSTTIQEAYEKLSCQHKDLVAYYKFDHGTPGGDNTQPQKVNWLRDHSQQRHHGRLTDGFALNGATSNWVEAKIEIAGQDEKFQVRSTFGNSNIVPEGGLLLQAPKLYVAETHPLQAVQKTDKVFADNGGANSWDDIAGLYLLVNVQPGDVLVMNLNARRLRHEADNAGVALGVAIEGAVDHRSGIYYERGQINQAAEERGGMSMQYVYEVPADQQGLLEVRAKFASYGGLGNAVIEQQGKSTLHVMVYSKRTA